MKIINNGNTYDVANDGLNIYDGLPVQTYTVEFHKMKGFYLESCPNLTIKEEKVYGLHIEKVKKVISSFKKMNKNLGTILSGDKGIGKSLFSVMTTAEALNEGFPVIIVNKYIPGIAQFLESIDQQVCVLFDEFDKTFSSDIAVSENDPDPQVSLLSMFDGVTNGKKLFIITCNNIYSLNEFLLNRPGRFHYHFRFNYPSHAEIVTYLKDSIDEAYYDEIDNVVVFSNRVALNYDCLRSIAFELNLGTSFKDAIVDLNIMNISEKTYSCELHFEDGTVLYTNRSFDMFSKEPERVTFETMTYDTICHVRFSPTDVRWDKNIGVSIIKPDKFKAIKFAEHAGKEYAHLPNTPISYISFESESQRSMHYNFSDMI